MPFLPFIPFSNCAEAVLAFSQNATFWLLTLGFQKAGGITGTDLSDLCDAIDDWAVADLQARISTEATLDSIKATDLSTAVSPSFTKSPTLTGVCTLAGTPIPPSVTMVVTFQTALRGRAYRGRNYVAGRIQAELQTERSWNATPVSDMQTAYANGAGYWGPLGWTHCVLSRQINNVRRTLGAATPVINYRANAQIGSMRGRLT